MTATRSLLVTGGSGSFGRCYVRAMLQPPCAYRRVATFSRDEVKAAALVAEFGDAPEFRAFLGDVRDASRLSLAFRDVHDVVHAAALKRIDAGTYSPSELIVTNILGTLNVVNEAIHAGVERVVVISSDKCTYSTTLYGCTKFAAELYAVQANAYGNGGQTKIAAVRYGNILGSRGSVVTIWREQALAGLPLRLTNGHITRFVMTIEQARDLVRYALAHMQGGEVFVPQLPRCDMRTLAEACWRVWGSGEPQIEESGVLRPGGEKMAECLLNVEEVTRTVRRDGYYVIAPSHHEWTDGGHYRRGEPVPVDFDYQSDRGELPLTVGALETMLRQTEALR